MSPQRINIRSAEWEHHAPISRFYEGIWLVTLDEQFTIAFVPAVSRDPWPPALPTNSDDIRSTDEARRLSLLSTCAVTPDNFRQGQSEEIDTADALRSIVSYCGDSEFRTAVSELTELSSQTPSVHHSIPLSDLQNTAVAGILRRTVDLRRLRESILRLRYYIRRDSDGSVGQLSRIIWDESGLSGQFWRDGKWNDNDTVTDYLLDGDGEDVTEEQATVIAGELTEAEATKK